MRECSFSQLAQFFQILPGKRVTAERKDGQVNILPGTLFNQLKYLVADWKLAIGSQDNPVVTSPDIILIGYFINFDYSASANQDKPGYHAGPTAWRQTYSR